MKSTQVTTWRRYSAAEKKAFRIRELKRRSTRRMLKERVFADLYSGRVPDADAMAALGWELDPVDRPGGPDGFRTTRRHHFADSLGSRVPTMRVNGDVL